MSVRVMTAVMDYSAATGSTYTVALILADHADGDGWCWPSLDRIARRSRVSRTTAIRAIAELETLGELVREIGGSGPRDTNRYRVMPGHVENVGKKGVRLTPLDDDPRVSNETAKGVIYDEKGCQIDTRTIKNRKEPRHAKQNARSPMDEPASDPEEFAAGMADLKRRIRPMRALPDPEASP